MKEKELSIPMTMVRAATLYNLGMTIPEIADKLQIHQTAVENFFKQELPIKL